MPDLDDLSRWADEPIQDPNSSVFATLPPNVRDYILSHPSFAEGERMSTSSGYPYAYRGSSQEWSQGGPQRDQEMMNRLLNRRATHPLNDISYQPNGGNMPWPNLTPQELAAYQMMSGGGMQNQAQGAMNPALLQQYLQMMQPQGMGMTQQAQQQPMTMANMLAARPNTSGGIVPLGTTGPGVNPVPTGNMSTIFNNPQLMQLLMRQYGGGAGM